VNAPDLSRAERSTLSRNILVCTSAIMTGRFSCLAHAWLKTVPRRGSEIFALPSGCCATLHADTPPRRHADTPIRRHADTPHHCPASTICPRGVVDPPAGSMLTANFEAPPTGFVGEKATRRSSSALLGTKPALTGCGCFGSITHIW
jgi:hypothetical protein